jgi:hypothetical protein
MYPSLKQYDYSIALLLERFWFFNAELGLILRRIPSKFPYKLGIFFPIFFLLGHALLQDIYVKLG